MLERLARECGYDDTMDMLQDAMTDAIVPAICTQCGCATDMEPDQNRGWCDNCNRNTVISCLMLAGII